MLKTEFKIMWLRSLFFFLTGSVILLGGCAKNFNVAIPEPSSVEYSAHVAEEFDLNFKDARSADDRQFSVGRLTANLNIVNEIDFLKTNLERELKVRGVTLGTDKGNWKDIKIEILKYRTRNYRSSGFTPYYTFTTFSADLIFNNRKQRITSYFKNGIIPQVNFSEVEDPCYNIPLSLLVKEVASKINKHVMKYASPDSEVSRLISEISSELNSEKIYPKVLELGYTNNPKAAKPLFKLASDKSADTMVKSCALSALGMLQAKQYLPFLMDTYKNNKNIQRLMALKAIGDMDTNESRAFIASVKMSREYEDDMIKEVADLY